MGSTNSTLSTNVSYKKVKGLQLPGQSGKTRKMEEKITEYMSLTRAENRDNDINIVFTSNNKILVEQTADRFDEDLGPASEESSVSSNCSEEGDNTAILTCGADQWTSSVKLTVNDIVTNILTDEISMIVCCANGVRFRRMKEVLKKLEDCKRFSSSINLWIDEAHKSIRLWKKYIDILNYSKIKSVTLVTATWDPIDKVYNIPRITYEVTHPAVYRSLHECTWKIVEPLIDDSKSTDDDKPYDSSMTAPGYIAQIINDNNYWNLINKPGTAWLIPGNSKIITHNAIAEDLVGRGWNGLILNGERKMFISVDGVEIDYVEYNKEKKEPKDVLAKFFLEYPKFKENPFFVTGLNCIKEGITFQGEHFMFDGAIIPHMSNSSDAYQLACRLAGNVKGLYLYKTHKSPVIITSSRMEKKIKRQENIAIFLPRILYEEGRTLPTEIDKNRAARGHVPHDPKGYGFRIFNSYDDYSKYTKHLGRKTHFTKEPNGGEKYPGKHICSVQSSRGATTMPRYLSEVIDKIELAYGGKGASKTGFPCYLDVEEAPSGLVWVVVIPSTIDKALIEGADSKCSDMSKELLEKAKDYK
jgi:hypothetical protein